MRSAHRGLTFVTVLIVLAIGGAVFWVASYGPAYWDNIEVKRILNEAANLAYHERNDEVVRNFVFRKLHDNFDGDIMENGRMTRGLTLDVTRDDLQVERTEVPPRIDLWLTYSRTVTLVLVGQTRTVTFTDHASQDLSPVKW